MSKKINFEIGSAVLGRMVSEDDIYRFVKLHSRLIDRLNPKKVYAMTAVMRDMFNIDEPKIRDLLFRDDWKFFGKHSKPLTDIFGELLVQGSKTRNS